MKKYYRNTVRKAKYGKVITGLGSKAGQRRQRGAYGHRTYGTEDPAAIASSLKSEQIRRLVARGMSMSEIAKAMGMTVAQLRSQVSRRRITGA